VKKGQSKENGLIHQYNKELMGKIRDARIQYAIENRVKLSSVVVTCIEPTDETGAKVRFRLGVSGVHTMEELGGFPMEVIDEGPDL